MTAPSGYCVLDGDGGSNLPKVPASDCEDMGGLYFTDDTANPPRTHEHLSSKDFMQVEMLVQRAWQMLPLLTIWASGTAGGATVNAIRTGIAALTTASVTAAHVSTGTYSFTLPTSTMSSFGLCLPKSYVNGATATHCAATQTANVVTLYQYLGTATADTGSWVIDIFGE